jgi:tRNA-specific 2-thiouridylase
MKKKVFVGLSGGVDSAVSALLLKQEGYDVTGVFMKNWSGEDYGVADLCPWEEDLSSAREVAKHLDIPLLVYNFEKDYESAVIEDFFTQYALGNTPNPDVLCNKYIKFSKFLDRAMLEGADMIATGHYSSIENSRLYRAVDKNKDQAYFLHQLNRFQLSKSIFPIGKLLKSEVRQIAIENGLPNANRKDSQGICFIGKVNIVDFLKNRIKEKTGEIIDIDTKKNLGQHNGVWFYTIGQRHGIGVSGSDLPYFVASKDVENNILYVAKGEDNTHLYKKTVFLKNFNLIPEKLNSEGLTAQIRYRGKLYNVADIKFEGDTVRVIFFEKVWAPALGQSVVIYNDGECLGGGIINEIID